MISLLKKTAACAFALCAAFAACAQSAPKVNENRDAKEFEARQGLPNFYAKLKNGEEARVAYFGGSITSQPGWRVQSFNYFKERYPNAKLVEINAAIGGTGSDLGAFRLERDVLSFKPDLVFVEFAVNDSGVPTAQLIKSMEGIVRQIWTANPQTDICFVYTLTFRDLKSIQAGKMMRSAAVMEYVAEHYGIPTVNMTLEIAALEKQGKLIMRTLDEPIAQVAGKTLDTNSEAPLTIDGKIPFSKDGVHPFPNTGHTLYMKALERAFNQLEVAPSKPLKHELKTPIDAANWQNVKALPVSSKFIKKSGNFAQLGSDEMLSKNFKTRADEIFRFAPNSELEFKFKGTKVSIYDFLGAGCGYVEVTLDGKPVEICRFDGYCNYYRLGLLNIGDNLEDKVHTVKIKVLEKTLDKREILFERNRVTFDKRPDFFKGLDFYPVLIFLIGDIAE